MMTDEESSPRFIADRFAFNAYFKKERRQNAITGKMSCLLKQLLKHTKRNYNTCMEFISSTEQRKWRYYNNEYVCRTIMTNRRDKIVKMIYAEIACCLDYNAHVYEYILILMFGLVFYKLQACRHLSLGKRDFQSLLTIYHSRWFLMTACIANTLEQNVCMQRLNFYASDYVH